MNSKVASELERIGETWFATPPEDMTNRELQMFGDIALMLGMLLAYCPKDRP